MHDVQALLTAKLLKSMKLQPGILPIPALRLWDKTPWQNPVPCYSTDVFLLRLPSKGKRRVRETQAGVVAIHVEFAWRGVAWPWRGAKPWPDLD